jgi:hypothetical protein
MNKFLLAAIALGLWANAASTFTSPARAGGDCDYQMYRQLGSIELILRSIDSNTGNYMVDKAE